jgi:hypothetical protein
LEFFRVAHWRGCCGWGQPRSKFEVRKFPELCIHHGHRALPHEEFARTFHDECDEAAFCGGNAFAEIGKFFLSVPVERDAEFLNRANLTLRRARRADERAKFHQGLVEAGAGILT